MSQLRNQLQQIEPPMSEKELAEAIEGLIEMGLVEPIYDSSVGDYRLALTPTGRSWPS
jgi:hypothetical protein